VSATIHVKPGQSVVGGVAVLAELAR
jgi:hypothetical protein